MANNTSTKKLVNELEKAVDESKKLLKVFDQTQDVTKDIAKELKDVFKGIDKKTSKGIQDFNKAIEQTNKLTADSEKLQQSKIKTESDLLKKEEQLSKVRAQEIKEKQEIQKLADLERKYILGINKEKERKIKITQKELKTSKKVLDAYQKESASLRKMKKDLKATIIEMRRMGKSELEVAKATKTAAKEINKLDRELRDLDKSVGDSFREIGKYENALNDLKQGAEGTGTALATMAGVVAGSIVSELVDGIEVSRGFQKTLDDTKSSLVATTKSTGQYAMSKAEQVKADLEASAAIKETTEALRFQRMEGEVKWSDSNYEEKKKQQKEEIKRLIILKSEQQIILDNYNKNKEEQKAFADLPSTTDIINDTEKALKELNSATLDNSVSNDKLERQLSILRGTQEQLKAISDDDTRSLNEAIEAKEELVKVNEKVAETQQKITEGDLDTETKRAVSTLVSQGAVSAEDGSVFTAEDVRNQLDNPEIAKTFSQDAANAFTAAYVANQDARSEAAATALETEEKLAKLYSDKIEIELDVLIDFNDKVKSINEKIIADDTVSNKQRQALLKETKKLTEDSFNEQVKALQKFVFKRIDLNSQLTDDEKALLKEKTEISDIQELLAIKDSKVFNEKLRQLGLSEIFETRTIEVIKEKIQANADLTDSEKELNKAIAKTNEVNEDILDQEEQLEILRNKEIDTQKELDDAQEKLEEERRQNRLDAIDKELEVLEKKKKAGDDASLEEVTLNQEKNNILIEQETKAAQDRIDIETKRIKDIADEEKKAAETRQKLLEDGVKVIDTLLSKSRDKQNSELEKELDALDARIDDVRSAIDSGNSEASQSLADLEKQKIEAQEKQEKLRKKEIRDQTLIAGLQVLASNDGNVGKTLGDVSLLLAALSNLPSFFDGTEDTGTVAKPLDSNGGRHAVLHDNERVMTAKQNVKLGGISNEDLADLGAMHNSGSLNGGTTIIQQNNKELISEVREMTKAVKSIPIQNYNYDASGKYHEQVIQSQNKKETIKSRANNIFK